MSMISKIAPLLLSTLLSAGSFGDSCPLSFLDATAPKITNSKLLQKSKDICLEGYASTHSGITKSALYSAEHVTKEQINVPLKRVDTFHAEERLVQGERAELNDYSRSGYDRGHLVPSADMWSEDTQYESFSLINIVPQNSTMNRGLWANIENSVRKMAIAEGELYVITGPLYEGAEIRTIGKNRVAIPTALYKIVYSPAQKKGAAYLANNDESGQYTTTTIAEVEKLAGINFFPKMQTSKKSEKLELLAPEKMRWK